MTHCVLLNADYSFLNVVDWKRALRMIAKGKVQIVQYSERVVTTAEGALVKIPSVMKLIKFIRSLYRTGVPFSKKNVFVRDGFKCAYCGATNQRLTIDHIIPKSMGGKTDFDNCISSCAKCNHQKGARTPSEANMFLKIKPFQPTISEFLRIKSQKLGINKILEDFGVY